MPHPPAAEPTATSMPPAGPPARVHQVGDEVADLIGLESKKQTFWHHGDRRSFGFRDLSLLQGHRFRQGAERQGLVRGAGDDTAEHNDHLGA